LESKGTAAMSIYYYLACTKCLEDVAFSRSGSAGNGPLAGDEHRFAFLDKHEDCGPSGTIIVLSEHDRRSQQYARFEPKP
jgi:hypothetical protein